MSENLPRARARAEVAGALPKQDVSIGELRQRLADAADLHGVSSTARVVLNALARRAGLAPDRRECRRGTVVQRHWVRADGFHVLLVWPGEGWLAEKVGKDPRTIRRAMKELVAAGLIERKARAGGAPGSRNGANLPTETHLLVPPKDRMPKARLRFHGSPADLAALAREGDPKARAALVDAAKALSEWTLDTVDTQAEQARRMVKGFVDRAASDVLAVIASIGGGPVGFYASLPQPAQARGTLLTGIDGEDTPKASGSLDLHQNGEDISDRTVRTDLSSPLITFRRTLKNQTKATASIDTEPQPVGVGLDCFAGQAAEPSEPSDPACPVETVETAEAEGEEHGWGQDGPELCDLTEDMIRDAVAAFPNLAAYTNEPKTMLDAWRKLRGYQPRSTTKYFEELKALGVREAKARELAEEFSSNPQVLRESIAGVRSAVAESHKGGKAISNPAGLLDYRLKLWRSKRGGNYSPTQ